MNIENLYAEFLLGVCGFSTNERYETILNEFFLDNPENNILLELEECSFNTADTLAWFSHYWTYENPKTKLSIFGKKLFSGLKTVYDKNMFSIEEFGVRCYRLWQNMPSVICEKEPFYTLSYADDCLSYGDEDQTRLLYEKAFEFYNQDESQNLN